MRICLVNTYHYRRGGDSTYTLDLAHLLESMGTQVIHFAMDHPQNIESPFTHYFADSIDYRDALSRGNPFAKVRVLFRSLYSFEARRKFASLLDETQPDIVHLQNFRRHLTFSIVTEAKKRGKPLVLTAHDYDPICPNSLLFAGDIMCQVCRGKDYYKAILKRCKENSFAGSLAIALEGYFIKAMKYYDLIDVIITPSQFARRTFIECGYDPGKVRAIPNFIDLASHTPCYDSDGYIISFGRLSVEKGYDTLIRAMNHCKGLKLVIAGEGPCRTILEQLCRETGCTNVELVGYVDRARLVEMVARAMFVVISSLSPENFPYSVLESFALGKPVIASNIGGIPEMVEDGKTGLLFSPGDAPVLAERIAYLENNPPLIVQMGENARKRVEDEFSPTAHYRNLNEVYQRVMR